ncbi:MAG: hypothetical protein NC419_03445 [Muribaculaceae bacterium]|nr:hypothetical protein [Muribaculaceae bacterium]
MSGKERFNLKFGDYIHKYFYDKSIADGYTLRIKKRILIRLPKILILDLGRFTPDNPIYQRFEKTVWEIRHEIKNNEDIKVVKLDQLLQEIFHKLSISDLSDLDAKVKAFYDQILSELYTNLQLFR